MAESKRLASGETARRQSACLLTSRANFSRALIAQFAGEPGAARRLSRELHARYGPQVRKGRRQVPHDWLAYQKSVVRMCAELQLGIAGLSFWDPARHTCALTWITQVEAAWHTYVTASAVWRSQL